MTNDNREIRSPFNHAVSDEPLQEASSSIVPDMIREDKSTPRPKPPVMGHQVDRQHFNQRWEKEVQQTKQLDPFDAIDAQKQSRQQQFNRLGDNRGLERN